MEMEKLNNRRGVLYRLQGISRSVTRTCTMSGGELLFLALLVINGHVTCNSGIVGCLTYQYLYNGRCRPCPYNCHICVSNTNCTECEKGFYGPVCENACRETCRCHKTYGYCTDGCPDKEYPQEGDDCGRCPTQCSLCESPSKCFLCEDGFYGVVCQHNCPDQCTKCDISTGTCLQCRDSYYLLGKQCKSCPVGCKSCIADTSCTQCHNAFWWSDGYCKSCPHGCSMCTIANNCQSCEDGFQGPVDGRCVFGCPVNDVKSYFLPDKDGRCGFWQDINNNICYGQSKSYSCTSRGSCIHYVQNYDSDKCGEVMQYKCKHACARVGSRYGCEENCTVKAYPNGNTRILCLTNTALIDQTFQIQVDCNPEEETWCNSVLTTIWIIGVTCSIFVIGLGIYTFVMLRSRRSKKKNVAEEDKKTAELAEMGRLLIAEQKDKAGKLALLHFIQSEQIPRKRLVTI